MELAGGLTRLTADGLLEDSGLPELTEPWQEELPVRALASEVLVYLLSSRYCDTESLMSEAWRLFQYVAPGWNRVQAICDFVHSYVQFGYHHARATRTASETYAEGARRVPRLCPPGHYILSLLEYSRSVLHCLSGGHTACHRSTLCPWTFARPCMEVYLAGGWYMFLNPRNNHRRIGRLTDRARPLKCRRCRHQHRLLGPSTLQSFHVWTDEVFPHESAQPAPPRAIKRVSGERVFFSFTSRSDD